MRCLGLLTAVCLAMPALALAADEPEANPLPVRARASTDKAAIKIGERLTYTITIKAEGSMLPDVPDIPEELGEFTVLDVQHGTPVIGAKETTATVTCLLTSYEVGKQTIPATEIRYKTPDGKIGTIMSNDVPIEVESVLPPEEKMEDIRDIRSIVAFTATSDVLLLIGGLILVLVLLAVFVLILILRQRGEKENEEPTLMAHEIALRELEKLRASGLIAAGRIQEFYYGLSDITRHYIESRFSLRAPERTTEEFLAEMAVTSILLPPHKDLLQGFLTHCDMVKYAKRRPNTPEIEGAVSAATQFIQDTKRRPPGGKQA